MQSIHVCLCSPMQNCVALFRTLTSLCVHTKRQIFHLVALSNHATNHNLSLCNNVRRIMSRYIFSLPTVLYANSFSSTMAEITTIVCLYLLWKRERRRNALRVWVPHINRSRKELGEFHSLLQELRLDDDRI